MDTLRVALLKVSIHVPARGTTITPEQARGIVFVSIHVPARGTTRRSLVRSLARQCFNPRSREGNDHSRDGKDHYRCSFNPRSREGNDGIFTAAYYTDPRFQSTFPRGERQQSSTIFTYRSCSFLCNYTNICFSIQVIPLITSLFPSIFHS